MKEEQEAEIIEISEIPEEQGKTSENTVKNPKNLNFFTLILVIVSLVLSGAALTFTLIDFFNGNRPITINSTSGNTSEFIKEGSIPDIVKKVNPSVVSITTETRTKSWYGQSSTSTAAGTGLVVSENGYILTNKHVISGASKISVILADGTTFSDVSVSATDPINDIAFLKINNASGLQPATLGDSKTIVIGQEVIAIGNALGQFNNTVTAGIVSGTGRTIVATDSSYSMSEVLSDLIQTDAAINAGNSGGPLVNASGEVIGINSATSASGEALGFAIPIASVKGMLSQLIESGKASRAFLGVTSISINPSVAEEYDLPVVAGAYLLSNTSKSAIQKGSAAESAGLKDRDIVTAVNGQKIGTSGTLTTLIGEYKPGDTIQLTLIRDGKELALNVTLGEYPKE